MFEVVEGVRGKMETGWEVEVGPHFLADSVSLGIHVYVLP